MHSLTHYFRSCVSFPLACKFWFFILTHCAATNTGMTWLIFFSQQGVAVSPSSLMNVSSRQTYLQMHTWHSTFIAVGFFKKQQQQHLTYEKILKILKSSNVSTLVIKLEWLSCSSPLLSLNDLTAEACIYFALKAPRFNPQYLQLGSNNRWCEGLLLETNCQWE